MITDVRNVQVFENGSMLNEDYHKHEGISSSGLYYFNQYCPAKFKYGEREETAALHFGTASHAAMLEPDLFRSQFVRDLSVDENEDYITNVKGALAEMKKAGVLMNKSQVKDAMKSFGALTTSADIKKALTDCGIKVKAGTKAEELVEMALDRLPEYTIYTGEGELVDSVDEILKIIPDAKIYTGDESAEQVFAGCAELCPELLVFPVEVKKWHDKHEGKTIVKADDYDMILKMRETLFATDHIAKLLSGAFFETSILCEIKVEGYDDWIKVKVRPDIITPNCMVPDYKTSRDIRPNEFLRLAYNGGYWFRQVFVCDVLSAVYGREFLPALIAQEKDAPFISLLYVLKNSDDRDLIGENREEYVRSLIEYSECLKGDVWPTYSDTPIQLNYPSWA